MSLKKRTLGSCVTFFPQPTTMVTTLSLDGEVNLMTASWAGIVSKTPPTMAVSFNQSRLSYKNIQETGEFVVNLVPAGLAVEADLCGIRSGRELDKAQLCHLELEPAQQVAPPLLKVSPLNVECRFSRVLELGDYRLVLGEILQIHAAEKAFTENPRGDARCFDPLVYLGGIREYWSLGEKVADAYQAGLLLLPKID
jgi:flavin reductase (DIM6/NTAB) family NADH-FMN oxidoreductase RutF